MLLLVTFAVATAGQAQLRRTLHHSGRKSDLGDVALGHALDGACVRTTVGRTKPMAGTSPWSVKDVLTLSGHVECWDGYRDGDGKGGWGPTLDENFDDVHPSEPVVRKQHVRVQAD